MLTISFYQTSGEIAMTYGFNDLDIAFIKSCI